MRISLTQHSVGQGGFFAGKIEYQVYKNASKNTSKHSRKTKNKTTGCEFKFVYDCGSNNQSALKREINKAFDKDECIDLLFLSHFDYDHVSGVKYLLSRCHVKDVVLPYLDETEKILSTAKGIIGANIAQSKFVADLIWDTENLLKETGNGVKRLIRIRHENGEDTSISTDGPADDPDFENLTDIFEERKIESERWKERRHFQIKTSCGKATKKSKSRKIKVYEITANQAKKMIWYINDIRAKNPFLLIPYVHPSCDVCLKRFSSKLKNFIRGKSKGRVKDYGKLIIKKIGCKCFRTELKKIYDNICPDHNLISMTLYAGPCNLKTNFILSGRSIFNCTQSGGFLLTGDASFSNSHNFKIEKIEKIKICGRCGIGVSDERRRDSFLKKYKECQDLVGAFMMPHHGSNYNFDFSVIEPFTELVTYYAAVGPNNYNHPGFWARLEASSHPKAKFETVETISSLALKIASIENCNDLIECLENLLDRSPKTLLHYASEHGNLVWVKKLLVAEKKKEKSKKSNNKQNVKSKKSNNKQNVKSKKSNNKQNVKLKDSNKMTPIHYAAMSGNAACVNALIEEGSGIRVKDVYGRTPLHLAARVGDQCSIKLLLNKNAQIGAKDYFCRYPLHYAAMSENLTDISVLIKDGEHVNKKDNRGMTPLHYAVERRNANSAASLIRSGADLEIKNNENRRPLYSAFKDPKAEFIQKLMCCGVDPKLIARFYDMDKELGNFDNAVGAKILYYNNKLNRGSATSITPVRQ